MTDRTVNYDNLLARESEVRERIAKALFELDMQKKPGQLLPQRDQKDTGRRDGVNTTTEWAAFRKIPGGDPMMPERPMEGRTFQTLEGAQKYIGYFIEGDSWLEVRSRHVTEWTK